MFNEQHRKEMPVGGVLGISGGVARFIPPASDVYSIGRSLRFDSSSSPSLTRTPRIAGNRRTWTWSGWVKLCEKPSSQYVTIFCAGAGGSDSDLIRLNYDSSGNLSLAAWNTDPIINTDNVFEDFGSWYHIVVTMDTGNGTASNRAKIYINGTEATYTTDNRSSISNLDTAWNNTNLHAIGLLTNSSGYHPNAYFADIQSLDGLAYDPSYFGKLDEFGIWQPKNYAGSYGTNGFHLALTDNNSDAALGSDTSNSTYTSNNTLNFNTATWTGNGSAQKIDVGFQPDFVWIKQRGNNGAHMLFDSVRGATKRLVANQTLTEGTVQGVTYFDSAGFSLGNDADCNANSVTHVGWAWKAGGAPVSNTEGSVTARVSANPEYGFSVITATQAAASGLGCNVGHGLGTAPAMYIVKDRDAATAWGVYHQGLGSAGKALQLNSTTGEVTTSGYFNDTAPTSSVLTVGAGVGLEGDDFVCYAWSEISGFSKFGTYTGNGSSTGPTITTGFKPALVVYKRTDANGYWRLMDNKRDPANPAYHVLFANTSDAESTSQGSDQYDVDFLSDGFQIKTDLASSNASGGSFVYMAFAENPGNDFEVNNMTASVGVTTASSGFDALTYSGTGASQSISSLAFSPGLLWIKERDTDGYHHKLVDSVRGSTRTLRSSSSGQEFTNTNQVTSFNADGFSLGADNSFPGDLECNQSGKNYVAWAWKAGDSTSSNTDGTITSEVSVSQDYGFSIVSYTGTNSAGSVGHGLNSAPSFWIQKARSQSTDNWSIYHSDLGPDEYLKFTSDASTSSSGFWGAGPTSSVMNLSAGNYINDQSVTYIAYCWTEKPKFSKFGVYKGNASDTGSIVTTGFKPEFVLIKGTSASRDWWMYDSARDSINPNMARLSPNSSGKEATNVYAIDFLDNGFQLKTSDVALNGSENYVYAAFAGDFTSSDGDSFVDTPEQRSGQTASGNGGDIVGNYATFNPLSQQYNLAVHNLNNGNLQNGPGNKGNYALEISTIAAPPSGKWYWEMTLEGNGSAERRMIGIMAEDADFGAYIPHDNSTDGLLAIWCLTGQIIINGSKSSYTSAINAPNTIGVALDQDNGAVNFYKNGTALGSQSLPTNMQDKGIVAAVSSIYDEEIIIANFGQRPFKNTPPSGYKSLTTGNISDSTVKKGAQYFTSKLYDGTGGSQTVTSLGFQPDMIWIKNRDTSDSPHIYDSIRGVSRLIPAGTDVEYNNSDFTSFDSNGFTLAGSNSVNKIGSKMVAWCWKAGGSASANNDGSITSQVSASQTSGFSVVTASPNQQAVTIGHGLGATPTMIISKSRTVAYDWNVFHTSLGTGDFLRLNTTDAKQSVSGYWGTVNNSVFGTAAGNNGNNNGDMVYYCFASIPGFSHAGKWLGTGYSGVDAPFIFTGFRPAWVLFKKSSASGDPWLLYDSARDPGNPAKTRISANVSGNESVSTTYSINMLSNGFKINTDDTSWNADGQTFVYFAIAENPFKIARAR